MATQSNGVTKFYEAMLSFPGMTQKIKLGFQISRTNILLLSLIIENGLMMKNGEKLLEVLSVIPEATKKELLELSSELLTKGELNGLQEKLNTL